MAPTPSYQSIDTPQQLAEFCRRAASSSYIGFDTEFVSENCYRPKLALLQVATDNEYAIIDPLEVDVDPFWELLVEGDHTTIAHAAREEFLFCYRACGQRPKHLFDIQLAAGMIGLEYPAAYGNLVFRLTGKTIDKGETRTDWMRRPLSDRQLDYALQDVVHLKPIYDTLRKELETKNRLSWLEEEMTTWLDDLERAEVEPQWRRVSGIANLGRRDLAIVRELWIVRDEIAQQKDRAPRRILPDDLLVELAKRGTSDPKRLKAIRGFGNRVARWMTEPIADAIEIANRLPDDELPEKMPRRKTMNLGLLGQFLTTALKVICKQEGIAAGIVASSQDVRELAAYHMGMSNGAPPPALMHGWRAEIVGQTIERMIDGSVAIRVDDPRSEHPLVLEDNKDSV